jgi:hypothetical protein
MQIKAIKKLPGIRKEKSPNINNQVSANEKLGDSSFQFTPQYQVSKLKLRMTMKGEVMNLKIWLNAV